MTTYLTHEELCAAVDAFLDEHLSRRAVELPEAVPLIDAIASLIAAGGKRLRPAFCYVGYRAAGGPPCDEIVSAAASLELLHSFALIHDDVMDAAATRRGHPTVAASLGSSIAVLAGDLALVLADDAFMSCGFTRDSVVRAFDAYSRMRREVIAGQFLDISASTPSVDDARRMALLKSGRYTVSEPLIIGCRLAGGSSELERALSEIGDAAGEAFQLHDDILGTFGGDEPTGKATDSDIRQGKHHFLFAHAAARLSGAERDRLISLWGRSDATDGDIEMVRELLEASGSREASDALISELRERADAALAAAPMDDEARAQIGTLIDRALDQ